MKIIALLLLVPIIALPILAQKKPLPPLAIADAKIAKKPVKAEQAPQPFILPAWAESPVSSFQVVLQPYTGWDVQIISWHLFQDPIPPLPPDPRNVAVQSSGRNNGAFYTVQSGFPTDAAARAWALATFPTFAPYTKWQFDPLSRVGSMVR